MKAVANSRDVSERTVHRVTGLMQANAKPPRVKVAICATHPIQYQAPLWRRLAQQSDLQVKAFFGTDMSVRGYRDEGFGVSFKWDTPLLEGYDSEFISTDPRIQRVHFMEPGFRGVLPRLAAFAPDVVLITAYRSLFHLGAVYAARKLGARVVMRHEASDVAWARSRVKGLVRDWLVRRLYARVDRFAAIGTEARRHLVRAGVPESRIGLSPYCVDSDYMETQVERWLPQRVALRSEFGIRSDDLALVFSGKLIARKDPLLITAAIAKLPSDLAARVHVIMAGDGELRGEIERQSRALLGGRLHMLGFLNQSEMGRAYAAADCLVLPSPKGTGETWGLVVNEAMQFGLPAIVSDGVGCHPDLVSEAQTGFVFPSHDVSGLSEAICDLLNLSIHERASMSKRARISVAGFSLEAASDGLAKNLRAACARLEDRKTRR